MNILHIVGGLPSEKKPYHHTFVKSQIDSLKKITNLDVIDLEGHNSSFNYIKHIRTIKKTVAQKNINIIHAHYSYCGLSALLAKTKVPIVLSLMGSDLLGSANEDGKVTLRGEFDKILSRYVANHVDHIIVKSQQMADKINLNVPVDVIPNGVDFSFFRPVDKNICRKKLNLDENKFLILFLGNPQLPRKNYKLAKEAVEIFINKLGNRNAEFITPFGSNQENILYYMNACDVMLLTSFWEGSPNVVKEAVACNLPIISTNVGDVEEVLKDIRNCFIVNYSKEEIVKKLKIIYLDNGRTNGRNMINYLGNEKIAEKILKLYNKVYNNLKQKKSV